MSNRRVSLEHRLAELGWGGVPFVTAFANIVWLYLSAGFDVEVPSRLIGNGGAREGARARACCERAALGMIEEAERAGRLAVLRCPCVREPFDLLETMLRLYGR